MIDREGDPSQGRVEVTGKFLINRENDYEFVCECVKGPFRDGQERREFLGGGKKKNQQ